MRFSRCLVFGNLWQLKNLYSNFSLVNPIRYLPIFSECQRAHATALYQYHFLINLDKKQVIHPHQIGNGLKLGEQIGWDYSTATVLVMLLAASSREGGRGGGDFTANHPLIG